MEIANDNTEWIQQQAVNPLFQFKETEIANHLQSIAANNYWSTI